MRIIVFVVLFFTAFYVSAQDIIPKERFGDLKLGVTYEDVIWIIGFDGSKISKESAPEMLRECVRHVSAAATPSVPAHAASLTPCRHTMRSGGPNAIASRSVAAPTATRSAPSPTARRAGSAPITAAASEVTVAHASAGRR